MQFQVEVAALAHDALLVVGAPRPGLAGAGLVRGPVVGAIVPSTSRYAIGPSRSLPRPVHSCGRTVLTASSSAATSASAKRRQKSPAVVGSGIRSAPTAFMYAVSWRSRSMSSSLVPPHTTL